MRIAFRDILTARRRIAPFIHRTPLRPAQALGQTSGHEILLKCEHHQHTGAFKLRGATNAVLSLGEDERKRGICTASTGNHGRAIAHAGRLAGAPAIVCMSHLVPANKVKAIEALGAEARIIGRSQDEAQVEVDRLVEEEGLAAIPPFDHPLVIAGQGTLGLEIMEDAPELDAVLVPLSGGGLIAGVALAVKTASPTTRVIGISMERGAAMHESLRAGHPVEVREEESLADSLGGGIGLSNRYTFEMVRDLVDETLTVSEAEIAEGIRHAYFEEAEVLEGAAAVGIAAILAGRFRPAGRTALVLSGRNIDMQAHASLIDASHPALKEGK